MASIGFATALILGFSLSTAQVQEGREIAFAEAPPVVRKTFQAETQGTKIDTLAMEQDEDGETIYWAEIALEGRTYAVGVLADGTLSEINLAVDAPSVPIDRCPDEVQKAFRNEAFGEKIDHVGKDVRYGVTIYEAVIAHQGKSYEIVVANDGTLVEKVLVVDEDEVEFASCPEVVRSALRRHARGGKVGSVIRSTGIGGKTFEAEVEIKNHIYLIEVDEKGRLLSKSLEAVEE